MKSNRANSKEIMERNLIESLSGQNAHVPFEKAVEDFPSALINRKIQGVPYSGWELLEHMRIAQWDILDFIRNEHYREPSWPEDYWPKATGNAEKWENSVQSFLADRDELVVMIRNGEIDLFSPLPHAPGYTLFREITVVANHNSYHTGQLVLLRRAFHG